MEEVGKPRTDRVWCSTITEEKLGSTTDWMNRSLWDLDPWGSGMMLFLTHCTKLNLSKNFKRFKTHCFVICIWIFHQKERTSCYRFIHIKGQSKCFGRSDVDFDGELRINSESWGGEMPVVSWAVYLSTVSQWHLNPLSSLEHFIFLKVKVFKLLELILVEGRTVLNLTWNF